MNILGLKSAILALAVIGSLGGNVAYSQNIKVTFEDSNGNGGSIYLDPKNMKRDFSSESTESGVITKTHECPAISSTGSIG
jgi:hypothetical protein